MKTNPNYIPKLIDDIRFAFDISSRDVLYYLAALIDLVQKNGKGG